MKKEENIYREILKTNSMKIASSSLSVFQFQLHNTTSR